MHAEPAFLGAVLTGIGDEAAVGIEGQIAAAAALGWRSLELRTVDGTPVADLSQGAFDRVSGALADAGMTCVAVDARIGGWARPVTGDFAADLAELAVLERRCARLGTRFVRVMSFPNAGLTAAEWEREALRRLTELARRASAAGLTLLHENCAGWAGTDPARMARLLDTAGPALGLLHDTGNGPAYGYDGFTLLERLLPYADRVLHVHVKDALPTAGGGVRYCEPGTGELRVADSLRLLLAHGYRGAFSIEPHIAVRPHEAFRDTEERCAAAFTRCGAALRRLTEEAAASVPGAPGGAATTASGGPGRLGASVVSGVAGPGAGAVGAGASDRAEAGHGFEVAGSGAAPGGPRGAAGAGGLGGAGAAATGPGRCGGPEGGS